MIVVADAGPIIHLSTIGHLDLIPTLFGRVAVPRRVYDEVVQSGTGLPGSRELQSASWMDLHEENMSSAISPEVTSSLDAGETAALGLALGLKAELILSDDRQARSAAENLGFRVRGTLGILLEARRQKRVGPLEPLLRDLTAKGYWLSDALIARVLREAGEENASSGRPWRAPRRG